MEKALTARDRFYTFFVIDDRARWKTIAFIILTGTVIAGIEILFYYPSVDDIVTFLVAWALICYTISIARYCWFQNFQSLSGDIGYIPGRRLLLQSAASVLVFIVTWKIPRAEALITERRLQETSKTPDDPQSARKARQVLSEAQAAGILAARSTVEQVGKKYISAGKDNPAAWEAAIAFVNYKSFLNGYLSIPVLTQAGPVLHTDYHFKSSVAFGDPQQSVAGRVPKEQASQFRVIGEHDLNPSNTFGNDLIIFEGGGISLDNMEVRRVVFRNLHIFYTGAPLQMEEAYFVNCIFHVEQEHNSPGLLTATLRPSPATSFTAS
jgi:hypothetical protein